MHFSNSDFSVLRILAKSETISFKKKKLYNKRIECYGNCYLSAYFNWIYKIKRRYLFLTYIMFMCQHA